MAPNYDYDPDDVADYDEYDEDDELSPEDRAALTKGTAEVRKALGRDAVQVTADQIQDALWHYYYDVDKTVAYLRKTFIPQAKPPPKKAPEGESGALFSFSAFHHAGADHEHRAHDGPCFPILERPRLDPALEFADMPWLSVPRDRQAVFIPPPRRGGLLGGGDGPPKMSKLQALAAARKKRNEQKDQEKEPEVGMKKLSISDRKESSPFKRQKLSSKPSEPVEAKEQEMEVDPAPVEVKEAPTTQEEPDIPIPIAPPSAFARTLFGSAPAKPRKETFAMPYTSSPAFLAAAFSKPSPDDVVLAAQAKAGKKAPAAKSKAAKEPEPAGMANLKISDAPPPKSKGLDVLKEFEASKGKKSASFVVVGHVDAGKSTLMGRLLLELKLVEERTVEKYRRLAEKSGKQSFALAWVMDQRSEERDRGVTIDIATNHFETESTKFTILDAPGHRDFIPNMIAGASQADFAVLVIDANTGAYEKGLKGQTREHVLLLRSLGVQRIIVAVNKLDMVGWSKDRFEEISQEVSGFLTGLGFQDKHISFIPISGLNGDNIVKKIEDQAASWYSGSTLIQALESSGPSVVRALQKSLRMSISEVFRSQQGTTTLAGRIDAGTMQVGDVLVVQPSGETAYIKSIMVDTAAQEWAVAGQSVSIALTDIDPIHIRVGDILCHTKDAISCSDSFTMKAMAFDHLMPMPVDLHRGRLHAPGQIESISATLDKATGQIIKKKPRVVQPGGVARVVIKLTTKVPLEAGQRVVIRSSGETIAAGLVE
ncbi:P-loop containing nucleoside triphosphate hydrolase protein [Stachybotrys elegans]|uniref:Elongation factor 1 alpha-like protein n=1 Tax=Stachybotrys elegans TaxID=80388 RepID=A0A8K0SKI9_9HYPO|nr:P-loop containing nucleoside triphosphate hydrolase protein [Stachybotrys elegans]